MADLSGEMAKNANSLSQMLSSLRPDGLAKLVDGLERDREKGGRMPHEAIMSKLRPMLARLGGRRPGKTKPLRLFCTPFETMLTSGARDIKQQGRIARTSIMPVWNWLSNDLLPDALPDMCTRIERYAERSDDQELQATVALLHETAAKAIFNAIGEVEGRDERLAIMLGGDDVLADARDIAAALLLAPQMAELAARLPRAIDSLNDGMLWTVREVYDRADSEKPGMAIYIPLSVMGRLAEPWQIMRLARQIAKRDDDTMIRGTDLAILGNVMIEDMEAIGLKLKRLRPAEADLADLLAKAKRFADISHGLSREIDIRRWGEWGQRLLAARNKVSTTIAVIMARFLRDLGKALPLKSMGVYGRAGPRQPSVIKPPSEATIAQAEEQLKFLEACRNIGEAIGIHADYKTVRQEIDSYLESYEDGIIEEIRGAKGVELENAREYVAAAARLRHILSGAEAASMLRRQAEVAAGA